MAKSGGPVKAFMVKIWCPQKQQNSWANATSKPDVRCTLCGNLHPITTPSGLTTFVIADNASKSKKSRFKKGKNQKKQKKGRGTSTDNSKS